MSKFKVGDKVRFKKTTSPTGRYGGGLEYSYKITRVNECYYSPPTYNIRCVEEGVGIMYDGVGASVLVQSNEPELTHKESFTKEISKTKKKIEELRERIEEYSRKVKFMEEHNLEAFDENVFKAYEIMRLSKDESLTEIARAKMIAELVKG